MDNSDVKDILDIDRGPATPQLSKEAGFIQGNPTYLQARSRVYRLHINMSSSKAESVVL